MLSERAVREARQSGYSVTELLVTLTVGAMVIAAAGTVGTRQQRFHRDMVAATERLETLDQASALIPVALRSIAPSEGDISPGGARDTSVEFRATIATAVVCDTGRGALVLAPARTDAPSLASILERPDAGDTVWSLTLAGDGETWTPQVITGVIDSTTVCRIDGRSPWTESIARPSLVLRMAAPWAGGKGLPIRITRLWRYSIYRASDGEWYLGARAWNAATLRFNTIQPVSGPFVSAARGIAFTYYDSAGSIVPSGSANTRGIRNIRIALSVDTTLPGKLAHAVGIRGSSVASIALRNHSR